MTFTEGPLSGAYIIDLDKYQDDRGFFARAYCQKEFAAHGLATDMVQTNVSRSTQRGTLRGMHYQRAPYEEAKLIRCTRGALYDVIVDLRPDSETYGTWMGVTLDALAHRMLYVPEGFAHGFLTLDDHTEVVYQVSAFYTPGAEAGLRYDDPALAIDWPTDVRVLSEKDRAWPDFTPAPLTPTA